jgi:N-glycosylase/DNA lyase
MQTTARFPVQDYNLAATLSSGQAFRWKHIDAAWEGVIHGRWVRLQQREAAGAQASGSSSIEATTATAQPDWTWLASYLRLDDDHDAQLASFPGDEPMRAALAHCHGLRLLRQDPWECLASFILSSTKQIVQIQQCVELLCQCFGERLDVPDGSQSQFSFPTSAHLATATETELRACKMGFRAKYLLAAAQMVASHELKLAALPALPLETARGALMDCPGVGRKIADCVLLFSCDHDEAFPIDVWVERALQRLYFPRRRARRARLEQFAATHFGPHAGLAQQYLFHYLRTGGHDRQARHAR